MNNPLVSIIVPIFNSELYLDKCIKSIVNQTYKDIQIILVNDGSTDGSLDICKKYSSIDDRVLIINKINEGVSVARNTGIENSMGDYILFVDSDDWLETDMILDLIKYQDSYNYDVILFGYYIDDLLKQSNKVVTYNCVTIKTKDEIEKKMPKLIKDEIINSPCNKLYKSSIIKNNSIRFNDKITIGEDALFNYQLFSKINSLKIVGNSYYHYVKQNSSSLTNRYNPIKYDMLIQVNNYLLNEFKYGINSTKILSAAKYIRLKNIFSCILDLFNKNNNLSVKDKKILIHKFIESEEVYNWSSYNKFNFIIIKLILTTKNINLIYSTAFIINKIRNFIGVYRGLH